MVFFQFQALKNSLNFSANRTIRVFLEVSCSEDFSRTIRIKTTNSSLVPQFIKFCTGEEGPVYKGASFYQGTPLNSYCSSILKVDQFVFNGRPTSDGHHDYASALGTNVTYSSGEVVCQGWSDGSFQLLKLTANNCSFGSNNNSLSDIIGIVENPNNIVDQITFGICYGNNLKIKDCGLVIDSMH